MLPISGKKIFSHRWWALLFAAGVCWTAIDVAGTSDDHAVDTNASAADLGSVVNSFESM